MKNIRIETIKDMVKEGMVVADIGTDHALLPILLIQENKAKKVYACDIAEGPLQAAKDNIARFCDTNRIPTILSDGFQNVPEDAQVAVIAGMGYISAKQILEDAQERLSNFQQIITEINRDEILMRQWISAHHYTIEAEAYVYERKHHYCIISFTTDYHASYTEEQMVLGPCLMQQKDPAYIAYLKTCVDKYEAILKQANGNATNIQNKKQIIQNYLKAF